MERITIFEVHGNYKKWLAGGTSISKAMILTMKNLPHFLDGEKPPYFARVPVHSEAPKPTAENDGKCLADSVAVHLPASIDSPYCILNIPRPQSIVFVIGIF
jgi:hypothetical protein